MHSERRGSARPARRRSALSLLLFGIVGLRYDRWLPVLLPSYIPTRRSNRFSVLLLRGQRRNGKQVPALRIASVVVGIIDTVKVFVVAAIVPYVT